MTSTRKIQIFISHSSAPNDLKIVNKLKKDLNSSDRFQVINDDHSYLPNIKQYISKCDWVVLVRTPDALNDPRVDAVVESTLDIVSQRARSDTRLQNIVALGVGPVDDIAKKWPMIRTYNAGQNPAHLDEANYSQAFDRMVKTLSNVRILTSEVQSSEMVWPHTENNLVGSRSPDQYPSPDPEFRMVENSSRAGKVPFQHFLSSQNFQVTVKTKIIFYIVIPLSVLVCSVPSFFLWHFLVAPQNQRGVTPTARATAIVTAIGQGGTVTAISPTPPPNLYATVTSKQTDSAYVFKHDSLNQWDDNDQCKFIDDGSYQVTNDQPGRYTMCMGKATNLSGNFAYQVQMVISGYAGGIIWRPDVKMTKFYRFSLGQNGTYSLHVVCSASECPNKTTDNDTSLREGSGLPVANPLTATLTVITKGNTLYLYVNGNFITSVQDSSSASGEIGVYAASSQDQNPTQVTFSNLKVWTHLP